MEEIKEIFESLSARIRSPFFGYLFFFTIFFNWKAWFYLLFAKVSVAGRFEYFENETTITSLAYIPLGLSFISTICFPWVRLFFVWAVKFPTTQKNLLQAQAESEILGEKNKLEKNRVESQAIKEESIISQAERDAKVQAIEDEKARDAVKKELETLRHAINSEKTVPHKNTEEDEFKKYLDSGQLAEFINKRKMILTESSFDPAEVSGCEAAKAFGLLEQKGMHLSLNEKGRKFFEWLILQ